MAKLKTPLLSFNARGTLAKILSFRLSRRQTIIEKKPIPKDAKSFSQLSWRHMYQKATALWHALSTAEKQSWESQARRKHMTGYAWFMSQCLKPNPGIYLPLQGGTMQGNIDMATHKVLALPAPTADQEPTRKLDLETHAAKNKGTHGVGTDYLAIASDSQYIAVRRAGEIVLGPLFKRTGDNDALSIYGGQNFAAGFDLYATGHGYFPGQLLLKVPNAAKTGWKYPLRITGCTDNSVVFTYDDNQVDLGTSSYKWRHIYTHGLTHDQLSITDRKCSKCGKVFQVGDVWAYTVIEITGDFIVKTPKMVKKLHNPQLPATVTVRKLNEWTGKYEDIDETVKVKVKRKHYYEHQGKIIKHEIEEEVENEYDAIDGEIEIPADGFMTCAPVCRICFLKD